VVAAIATVVDPDALAGDPPGLNVVFDRPVNARSGTWYDIKIGR
jgi:hypothetical protein